MIDLSGLIRLNRLQERPQIPFTRFAGRLKQLSVSELPDIFNLFFPRFLTESEISSYLTRGRGHTLVGDDVILGKDSAVVTNRGRERRFAGDTTLQSKQCYCLEDAPTNHPTNNTLLNELFAYAEPRLPSVPELLDSTVDIERAGRVAADMGWKLETPCVLHIVRHRDEPWLFSPVLGIPPEGCVIRYPLTIVDTVIEQTIDLRLPATLQWFFQKFVNIEILCEGRFAVSKGKALHPRKGDPPKNPVEFVRTLLSQSLGGGTTFIQGIGAWLRSQGVEALIYPSARANSRSVTRNGVVEESYGYVLVDYRNSPPCDFVENRYFGVLPAWSEKNTRRLLINATVLDGKDLLRVEGALQLNRYRFHIFYDWNLNTFNHARNQLKAGTKKLGDPLELMCRRPSDIVGRDAEVIIGSDADFGIKEGGPAEGFLKQWKIGPYNTNGSFIASVLPAAQSQFWVARWSWDETNWFLHRCSTQRPWAILKCPVCLSEYFWNVLDGAPVSACLACRFANGGSDPSKALGPYAKWAQETAHRLKPPGTDESFDAESVRIQSAVCEKLPDAVTGWRPPL
jgi:hypothetical protein